MADAFELAQITAIEAQITAMNATILSITTGGMESYKYDTGQSIQWVTKLNISVLTNVVDSLMNQRAVLRIRCGLDSGVTQVIPGF